ncbi:hypothetical protein QN277_002308 [Acacia crassicarpa]|uniref:Ent-kaurene synthase n=1 Tax=Acacia crassicarpa TaxID=499986 RepID=A0AAE1NAQ0_9FABA|nr:hypothetical protein QN277_002308 [Acacia crassicarpa]
MFDKVELSVSSYDTAWVAMIPSPSSPQAPMFPQTLNWLLENQQNDGSWSLPDRHELLTKDSLLSTLASVLALKHWGVGEQRINRGLGYIESNIAAADDDKQLSSIGFDIIFSHLIERAQSQDLNLPLGGNVSEKFIRKRDLELQSGWGSKSEGWKAYVAYISEGFGKSQNWEMAKKFQRKNGSLLNSPAATAAQYTYTNNAHSLDYLLSLLDKYENAVPTIYPLDVYARLQMVDNLEKLGIDRHFKEEIGNVLDDTWRKWQQEEDEIVLEPTTCAIAFRLLCLHGYDVCSGALDRFSKDKFCNTIQGYLKDVEAVLELHKASHIVLHSNDSVLEELNSWTGLILQEYLSSSSTSTHQLYNHFDHEVTFALRFPHHAYLDFIFNRRSIKHYKVDQKRTLKSSYSSLNLANKEFLKLGTEDFSHHQSLFREEFDLYNQWVMQSGLERLVSKTKVAYNYFSAAATLTSPELREARLAWAKQGLVGCVVDDFFDVSGTEKEQINLVNLMDKWDVDVSKESCSETVKMIFLLLKRSICETAAIASKVQGRSVLNHLIQIWVDLLRCELKEAEWGRGKCSVPSIEECERNGSVSMALGPIMIPVMYLVGPKLPQAVIESDEYNHLFELVSLHGRYLNDINGYQREKDQGKLINLISLRLKHCCGEKSEQEIIKEMESKIDETRKEVLRLVVQKEGSIIPYEVKDVYWKMCRALYLVYKKDDVIHAKKMPDEMLNIKDVLLSDPIILDS